MPTPAMAFLTVDMRCDAGVMISASHNPYQDNGIKFFSHDGFKLPDEVEARDRGADRPGELATAPRARGRDRPRAAHRRRDRPLRRVPEEDLPAGPDARGPAHRARLRERRRLQGRPDGALASSAPRCSRSASSRTGATSTTDAARSIPRRVRRRCGAARRRRHRLDGDADRCVLVDEKGEIVDGDAMLALCARDLVERGGLRGGAVVATVMSNLGLERAARAARAAAGAHGGRRPLRRRGDARGRLQPRRRAVGPRRLPRPQHDRRRPAHRAAGARDHAPQRSGRSRSWSRASSASRRCCVNVARRGEATARELCRRCRRRSQGREGARRPRPRADPLQRHRAEGARHGRGRGRDARARIRRARSPSCCGARSAARAERALLILALDALPRCASARAGGEPRPRRGGDPRGAGRRRRGSLVANEELRPVREADLRDVRRAARALELRIAPTPVAAQARARDAAGRVVLSSEPTGRGCSPRRSTPAPAQGRAARRADAPRGGHSGLGPRRARPRVGEGRARGRGRGRRDLDGRLELPEADRGRALERLGDAARLAAKLRLPVASRRHRGRAPPACCSRRPPSSASPWAARSSRARSWSASSARCATCGTPSASARWRAAHPSRRSWPLVDAERCAPSTGTRSRRSACRASS